MTKVKDLHRKWLKDPEYRKEYEALEGEFVVERKTSSSLYGALKDIIVHSDDDLDKSTLPERTRRKDQ